MPQSTAVREDTLAAAAHYGALLRGRGVAALAFAGLVFIWPGLALSHLTLMWGAYSLVDGGLVLASAARGPAGSARLLLALVGVAGLACAAAVAVDAATMAGLLVPLVAAWAVVTGLLQLWAALQLRAAVERDWILVLDGLAAIGFGLALVLWPGLEIVGLAWLVGWFALTIGSLYLAIGLWLRRPA